MSKNIFVYDEDGYIIRCPKCNSGDLTKAGFYKHPDNQDAQRWECRDCKYNGSKVLKLDPDLIKTNVKYKKQTQLFQDINRIERKAFRELARIENALGDYNEAIIQRLDALDFSKKTILHDVKLDTPVGLLHLSDLHLNELVNETHALHNRFDFEIASKRLRLLAQKAIHYFGSYGVTKIVVAFTGDLINSDRRIDELLHMATNRSDASLLAVHLLSQMLLELNEHFNIEVVNVSGNESRMTEYTEYNELLARDNYDWTIYNFLSREFKDSEGIKFIKDLDARQNVINVNGQNVLVIHGEKLPMEGGVEKAVIRLMGQWSNKGVKINFVILGHFHSARIGDTYGRTASLVGANAYSEDGLHLVSMASQNAYLFYNNGERDHIRFGLQNVKDIEGYDIIEELIAYDAKSASKNKSRHTVKKIVT